MPEVTLSLYGPHYWAIHLPWRETFGRCRGIVCSSEEICPTHRMPYFCDWRAINTCPPYFADAAVLRRPDSSLSRADGCIGIGLAAEG